MAASGNVNCYLSLFLWRWWAEFLPNIYIEFFFVQKTLLIFLQKKSWLSVYTLSALYDVHMFEIFSLAYYWIGLFLGGRNNYPLFGRFGGHLISKDKYLVISLFSYLNIILMDFGRPHARVNARNWYALFCL